MTVLCVMWCIAGVLVTIFGCTPVAANYVVTYWTPDHCIPYGIFNFFMELTNALFDCAILAMPSFVVRRLQLSPQRKKQVIGIFLLGGLYVTANSNLSGNGDLRAV